MRYAKIKRDRWIWVRISRQIIIEAIENKCCSTKCPYIEINPAHPNSPGKDTEVCECTLSGLRVKLRRSFGPRWHRSNACLNAEKARKYLLKAEHQE